MHDSMTAESVDNRYVQRIIKNEQKALKLPTLEALMLDMEIDEVNGKSFFNFDNNYIDEPMNMNIDYEQQNFDEDNQQQKSVVTRELLAQIESRVRSIIPNDCGSII